MKSLDNFGPFRASTMSTTVYSDYYVYYATIGSIGTKRSVGVKVGFRTTTTLRLRSYATIRSTPKSLKSLRKIESLCLLGLRSNRRKNR